MQKVKPKIIHGGGKVMDMSKRMMGGKMMIKEKEMRIMRKKMNNY